MDSSHRLAIEVVVLLALCSAGLFGASSVLMHSKAHLEPAPLSLRAGLLANLAREPVWLAGLGGQAAGFGLQAAALGIGSLVIVQAMGPASLLVALPLAAVTLSAPMHRADWVGALATVGGLTAFLVVDSPHRGWSQPSPRSWMIILAASVVLVVGLVIVGRRGPGPIRALALATASGVVFAVNAALTKVVVSRFGRGVVFGFRGWELYLLIGLLPLALLLMQSSFQAGRIEWSLPAITVSNPVLSLGIGVVAFHENLTTQGVMPVVLATSLVVTATGVVILARSPALTELHEQGDQQREHRDGAV